MFVTRNPGSPPGGLSSVDFSRAGAIASRLVQTSLERGGIEMRRLLILTGGVACAMLLFVGQAAARVHHKTLGPVAHAATENCDETTSFLKLKQSGNDTYVYGQIGTICYSGVTSQFAEGILYEKWIKDGLFHEMNTGTGRGEPLNVWSWAYPQRLCTGSATRQWEPRSSSSPTTARGSGRLARRS